MSALITGGNCIYFNNGPLVFYMIVVFIQCRMVLYMSNND